MPFYDTYTGKKYSPRDDWRDDEKTRRPKRDAQMNPSADEKKHVRKPQSGNNRNQSPKGRKSDIPHGNRQHEPFENEGKHRNHEDHGRYEHRDGQFHHGRNEGHDAERHRPHHDWHDENEEKENLLVGRNPIREALKANRDMEKLLVAKGELMGSAKEIIAMARDQHIVVQEVDRARLDSMAANHQGMIAIVSAYEYKTIDDIYALAASKNEEPFIVVLDGIQDPHNLGAIIRSAECAGAHGVIIPARRAVGLTPTAVKASAGAVEHIPVVRETNLSRTIERLKKDGAWVFGSSMNGKNYRNADYSGPVALVIGSEGEGISKLVAEHCDDMISIPMRGQIDSLNASVAAGILLFGIAEKRGGK